MADNILVTLTSPEGATLKTAGKYCEGDIEVVPKLQSKTATTGEIVTADAGYVGLSEVDTNPVFEAGKKSEYDAFWDSYQHLGRRIFYMEAFAGTGWDDTTFNPKYDILPEGDSSAVDIFSNSSRITDIYAPLDKKGLVLDFSKAKSADYAFNGARKIPYLRTIDLSSVVGTSYYTFGGMTSCHTIEKVVVHDSLEFKRAFNYDAALENLTIEGTIGQGGLDLSWSPLSKASLISVINALSSTTTGQPVTLRLAAVNTAFETSAGAADGSTSEEWTALIATKPNWTINLINS